MHIILWDFEIQIDHLISARTSNLEIVKKKKKEKRKKRTRRIVDFAVPADHRVKIKERDKYFDLARELRKLWSMRVTVIPIVIGAFRIVPKGLEKGTGRVGNWRTSRGHPNYSIIEISQNNEKSQGSSRRLTVTQDTSERPSANAGVKTRNNNNNNIRLYQLWLAQLEQSSKDRKILEGLKIKGRLEILRTAVLLRLARILRRVLKTGGDMLILRNN